MNGNAIVVIGEINDSDFAKLLRYMVLHGEKPQTYRPNFARIFGTVEGKICDDVLIMADRHVSKKSDPYANGGMSPEAKVDTLFDDKIDHLPPGGVVCVVFRSSDLASGQGSQLIDQLHRYWSGRKSDGSVSWPVRFFDLDETKPFDGLV